MTGLATLLVLADGRLPSGGHAHSSGLEAAVVAGRVHDLDTLAGFLTGRLATGGRTAAAFAAAAAAAGCDATAPASDDATARLDALDDGLDARTPSPALRRASRTQGRALLRAGRSIWSMPADGRRERHQPVALGAVTAAAGLGPAQAALTAAYGAVTGPASAAVRLLGLDPYAVHGLLARLAPQIDAVAAEAATMAGWPVDDLPAGSAPIPEVDAEHHATWEVRLFAS
ncbi:urease accessory protein UreF [Micromonospora sp. NBC_01813]|uniref:urease accessory protein UreF n=1 Tax=Micromonospora sp. NBC_01813 TaxID=2975988 RepID=UPI002DDC3CE4|nr:urease accessory UreF family protein [Micromonospora sp. NBC_01813]WSA10983.1 urease accessory protein UreF [Micromonospora sp. NBC_01813]